MATREQVAELEAAVREHETICLEPLTRETLMTRAASATRLARARAACIGEGER